MTITRTEQEAFDRLARVSLRGVLDIAALSGMSADRLNAFVQGFNEREICGHVYPGGVDHDGTPFVCEVLSHTYHADHLDTDQDGDAVTWRNGQDTRDAEWRARLAAGAEYWRNQNAKPDHRADEQTTARMRARLR